MSAIAAPGHDENPLALAETAFELVQANAADAATLADRALVLARAQRDREAEVTSLHALSFAQHQLHDPRALRTIRAAIRVGERHGVPRRAALARRRLAFDLANRGSIGAALRELEIACAALDPLEQARSEVFRVAILMLGGRPMTSRDRSDAALETLRRAGDTVWEARLLRNRGELLAERGDTAAAELELTRARELYASLGASQAATGTELQLARTVLIRGDVPGCLARLDAIAPERIAPKSGGEVELLRAQALTRAQLWSEAQRALEQAQELWARGAHDDYEGRLEVIRVTLLAGDPARARALARSAQRAFASQKRGLHAARAAGLGLVAAIAQRDLSPAAIRAGRRAAATLAAAGWQTEAGRVHLAVARAAIELGSVATARHELARGQSLLQRAPIADRIEAWHVEALIRLGDRDPAGAQAAARRGLRVLEQHRAALGAADLRATASSIGSELAALGLRIALADTRPQRSLDWAEALRATALRLAPVTPPDDADLRAALTELRQLTAEIARSEQAGRPTRALLARQTRVEAQVRRLSRHAPGEELPSRTAPSRRELARALERRALVEFVESDGELTALTLADGRLQRYALGPVGPVEEQLEWLRFGLGRLAQLRRTAPQLRALAAGALSSAAALERHLITPLQEAIGDRELVLVPTGVLHALPWAMLPSLRGRAASVAPSAAVWWALETRPRSRRKRVIALAGPRLRHARAEVERVAEHHPGARTLTGAGATVGATLRALDGAALAHLACHGHVRADSPLFSSLELADGRLNAYELAHLARAPDTIVLSACDLAVSDARPGDELLGFAGALLDMGTRTIIASVVPVPDAAARRIMPTLHHELVKGATPARALARAQSRLRSHEAALAGFVCLGAGPYVFRRGDPLRGPIRSPTGRSRLGKDVRTSVRP